MAENIKIQLNISCPSYKRAIKKNKIAWQTYGCCFISTRDNMKEEALSNRPREKYMEYAIKNPYYVLN